MTREDQRGIMSSLNNKDGNEDLNMNTCTFEGKKAFKEQKAKEWGCFNSSRVVVPMKGGAHVDYATYAGKFLTEWNVSQLIEIYFKQLGAKHIKPYILRRDGKAALIDKIIDLSLKKVDNEKSNVCGSFNQI